MAAEAERVLGDMLAVGIVVDVGDSTPLALSRRSIAGHPLPDRRSQRAARAVLDLAHGLGHEDILLVLLSGGASALLAAPAPGITLGDKARTTNVLLRAGADIQALNAVRKHLSRLKGGWLAAAACPARLACLVLSDVVGDDLATIASGPTVPDPTTFGDARAALERFRLWRLVPAPVRRAIVAGEAGRRPETPKAGSPAFRRTRTSIIGSGSLSLKASDRAARDLGLRTTILTSCLTGEAGEVGRDLVAALHRRVVALPRGSAPICLLAAGETTVTVRGGGRGGRNQVLACSAAEALATSGVRGVVAALGTDGIDGNSPAAGGIVDHRTTEKARRMGLPPLGDFLDQSDTFGFLSALGDAIVTGPTGTNVADLVVLLASA